MATKERPHHAKSRKAHKARRNYRWGGVEHSVTKYRARHHIAADAKRGGLRGGERAC